MFLALSSVTLCSAETLIYAGPGNNQIDGFYAYPYYVQVNGAVAAPMMCDDFTDEIGDGYEWLATANTLTSANVQNGDFLYSNSTSFGAGDIAIDVPNSAVQAYDEAGFIFTGMFSGTINPSEGNAAVWYLFSPGPASAIGGDAAALGILDQAYESVSADASYNYSDITVYTPKPNGIISPANTPGEGQELFAITASYTPERIDPGSAVPEPPPSLLLAAGAALIGLNGLVRRRLRARA